MSYTITAPTIELNGNVTSTGSSSYASIALTDTTNQIALGTTNTVTINAPAPASSIVLTLPITADTLVGRDTTDTLANKTLTAPVVSGILYANAITAASDSDVTLTPGTTNRNVNVVPTGTGMLVVDSGNGKISANIMYGAALRNAGDTAGVSGVQVYSTGTNTSSSSVLIGSTNGGITVTANGTDKDVVVNTNGTGGLKVNSAQPIKVDTIKESTTNATTVTLSNTGTSTSASAIAISSTSGGITITPAANKNMEVTTSGTGRITNNSIAVPTISSTDTLTNKTIVGTDNTVYRTTSRMKYTTTVATSIADSSLTYMPFATAAESTGRLSTEISVTGTDTKFGNNAGATRFWYVTCQMFTTGNTHVIVIDHFNSSDQMLNRFTTAVGTNTNDIAVSANGISMAQGDYIKCGIFHIGAGLTLYYSAGPPTIISALYISE